METIYGALKKLESKEILKEKNQRTVSYTAEFVADDEIKVRIKRDDIPFDELVVGEKYSITIKGLQTTLDSHIQEEEGE